jgi:hypothetical protein
MKDQRIHFVAVGDSGDGGKNTSRRESQAGLRER